MAVILGGEGNDTLFGTSETDSVDAGAGNDTVTTGCYADLLVGGFGSDTLNGGHGGDSIYGGLFDAESLVFTPDNDVDTLNGGFGGDRLFGGARDILNGGVGFDSATLSLTTFGDVYLDFRALNTAGGVANFSVVFGEVGTVTAVESMTILTGAGNDTVISANMDTEVVAGAGNDAVIGGTGSDTFDLGDGADYAEGGAGGDVINALLEGAPGQDDGDVDRLIGGGGSDDLTGSNSDNYNGGTEEDGATIVYSLTGDTFVDLRGYTPTNTYFFEGGGSIINVESVGIVTQGGNDTVLDFGQDGFASTNGGNDIIVMGAGSDTAIGGEGADYIEGNDGDDELTSGTVAAAAGALIDDGQVDRLLGGNGSDTLILGIGDFGDGGTDADDTTGEVVDTAVLQFGTLTENVYLDFTNVATTPFFGLPGGGGISTIEAIEIFTGSGADTVIDTNLDGVIDGGAGNDILVGQGGEDTISGNFGNDYLNGGEDDDFLSDAEGTDELRGGGGDDTLFSLDAAAGGADIVVGEDGDDSVFMSYVDYADGGAGTADSVLLNFMDLGRGAYFDFAGAANGAVVGLEQFGGAGSIRGFEEFGAFGGEFNDTFLDADTDGFFVGGGGDDILVGRGGDDFLISDEGNDYLDGGIGNDFLLSDLGNDTVKGGDGDDFISGGVFDFPFVADDDILQGEAGNDNISGGDGYDFIDGGTGNDRLNGDGNHDNVFGGDGNDTVAGDCGDDVVGGGAGLDVFVFVGTTEGEYDTVIDFNRADDSFRIEREDFSAPPLQFTGFQEGDFNNDGTMDTRLGYSSGNVVVLGVTGLTLEQWNGELVS